MSYCARLQRRWRPEPVKVGGDADAAYEDYASYLANAWQR